MQKDKDIATSVHGDDFIRVGARCDLDWLKAALEKRYEFHTGGRFGPGTDDASEILVMNRVIRWTSIGIEYEADPRQAERLLEGLALDSGCKTPATTEVKPLAEQLKEDVRLPASGFTEFRGLAARSNYLPADSIDLQCAVKEVCHFISAPTEKVRDRHEAPGQVTLGAQGAGVDLPMAAC